MFTLPTLIDTGVNTIDRTMKVTTNFKKNVTNVL